ncbi:YbaB/EbfC DNA-binding family protein [Actinomadura pelletieri DSM 43383]|uniref:YbaB/EbfC DNA-binding family protein n=1 Tax=Actinomadura pelletieri DSM 43383 TaxID=1120940 RepID=A0A495QXU6_9ACTN|nr:YbaB/EbfC family nucleoid-associated protein [Actinomadura pelletieri]RKS78844.1 YbaB/EbfC DNA-binding family protein [Actinomadura pelletieri DSM 43383]
MSDNDQSSDDPKPFGSVDQELADQLAVYRDVREKIQHLTASVASQDRTVTVTVGSGGAVQDIKLQQQALRLGPEQLARTLITVIRKATAEVNQEMAALVQPIAPPGVDVMGMVDAHLPNVEVEDPELYLRKRGIRW